MPTEPTPREIAERWLKLAVPGNAVTTAEAMWLRNTKDTQFTVMCRRVIELEDRIDAIEEQREAVLALHKREDRSRIAEEVVCARCNEWWPCPTVRALGLHGADHQPD